MLAQPEHFTSGQGKLITFAAISILATEIDHGGASVLAQGLAYV